MKSHVIFCGFQGCGKTSLGRQIALRLNMPFVDTDHLLERHHHLPCAKLHKMWGENEFRRQESKIICGLHPSTPTVIALGGGALLRQKSCDHLKRMGKMIYLKMSMEEYIQKTLARDPLPTFIHPDDPERSARRVFQKRKLQFQRVADLVVTASDPNLTEKIVKGIYHS